ncbi:MAG: FkbM family methyltransferase [bacterium]
MKHFDMFNRGLRQLQNLLPASATQFAMRLMGEKGIRFVREFTGRSARHRIQISCARELVGVGAGAWTICPDYLNKESIVYSLGIGTDISFDLALIDRYKVNVFAFDPTPRSLVWLKNQTVPELFHLVEWGVHNVDGFARFIQLVEDQYAISMSTNSDSAESFQVHRLKTIMEKFGHRQIDLLKINIEGGEYSVLEDLLGSQVNVAQIVVEFHHRLPGHKLSQTEETVNELNRHGYKIFNITNGKEYSFIKPELKRVN